MKKSMPLMLCLLLAGFIAQAAFVSNMCYAKTSYEDIGPIQYPVQTTGKLTHGLTNLIFGWSDIILRVVKEEAPIRGIVRGAINAVIYTVGGLLEVVTFPIPFEIPMPDGGIHWPA
jgi:hypothetical protein